MKIKVTGGQEERTSASGRHFRILATDIVGEVYVRLVAKGSTIFSGYIAAGIGIDFSDKSEFPSPFDAIYLLSPVTQTINVWAEMAKADDDRAGANAVVTVTSSAGSSATLAKQTLTDTVNGHTVLPVNGSRASATIQLSGDCYIDSVADGVLVTGTLAWENRGALKLIPVSSGVECRILEEVN